MQPRSPLVDGGHWKGADWMLVIVMVVCILADRRRRQLWWGLGVWGGLCIVMVGGRHDSAVSAGHKSGACQVSAGTCMPENREFTTRQEVQTT